MTQAEIKDVKIGETYIAAYVAPGSYVNYWAFTTVTGKLSLNGITLGQNISDINFNIKSGYWIYITAEYTSDGSKVVRADAVKYNSSTINTGDWQE